LVETFSSDSDDASRRFDVELFIVHPTLDPAIITAKLGMEAQNKQRVGDPRTTPKKMPLPGNYRDTRWRHSIELELADQWFGAHVAKLVDSLIPHKAFLKNVRATGGTSCVIVQFFDAYYGDSIARDVLAKMVDLDLDLGIECFSIPQNNI
jgi:hypothetical protein